jgi:hypothetical protein
MLNWFVSCARPKPGVHSVASHDIHLQQDSLKHTAGMTFVGTKPQTSDQR